MPFSATVISFHFYPLLSWQFLIFIHFFPINNSLLLFISYIAPPPPSFSYPPNHLIFLSRKFSDYMKNEGNFNIETCLKCLRKYKKASCIKIHSSHYFPYIFFIPNSWRTKKWLLKNLIKNYY